VTAKDNFLRVLAAAAALAMAASILMLLADAQPVKAAFPGTNGRVVFERDPDGFRGPEDPEIYTISFTGDDLKRLTNNSTQDTGPSYSADGKKIVFSGGDRRAWDSYKADIFTMAANGSNKSLITDEREIPGAPTADDTQPAFSPGGGQIVFVRNGPLRSDGTILSNDDIYKIRVGGSGLKRLVNTPSFEYYSGCCPTWSPDGSRMAFYSNAEDDYRIEAMRPDGTDRKYVASGYTPSWSPDGSQLVFARNGDIYKINADGTGEDQLTTDASDDAAPAFAPGGGKIVFSSDRDGDFDLYVMDSDGTDVRRLTNGPGYDRSPDWQPVR